MITVQILACIVIIVILIKYLRKSKNKRFYELLEQFPSHPKYPLVGNAHMLFGPVDEFLLKFEKMTNLHDRVLFWFGPIPALLLKKHDDIAAVLNQSSDRDLLGTTDTWLGMGILNARYEEWKTSRKMLSPGFSSNMLLKYAEVFEKHSLKLVENLKPFAISGEEIDVWNWLTKASIEAISGNRNFASEHKLYDVNVSDPSRYSGKFIEQKVYDEVSKLETDDGTFAANDIINNMPYLEQFFKETLRMFSPVQVTTRRIHKDIMLKDNKIIPANTFVITFIHIANYDPELYKNPEKFDPEHFSKEAVEARPKTSQLSFGYGARSCLGAKYAMLFNKMLVAYILRNYHLSTSVKEITKEHLKGDLCIKSKIGYPIKFTSRSR